MNLSRAQLSIGLIGVALPPSSQSGIAGGRISIGQEALTVDYPSADVIYSGKLSGITNTVNPTLVLATGVVTLNGATLTGMTSGTDEYGVAIPGISTGYAVLFFRTDANAGVMTCTGGTTGFKSIHSAGKRNLCDQPTVVQSDTITFANSTSASADCIFVVLGKDV